MRRFALAFAVIALALGSTACPEKGPAQKAGEAVDGRRQSTAKKAMKSPRFNW
jgi:hypothetical protein